VENAQLQNLENEVENLKHQLDMEKATNRRLEELYQVYTNIQSGLEPDRTFRLAPAKVIAVEPTDWFRHLTIDKGEKHGVTVDMAVITRSDPGANAGDTPHLTGAIVGKIVDVQQRSARVQLITDRLSVVAVTIGSLGDLVLLRGQPETENCAIDEVPSTTHDRLKKGDAVIVDERSSIFPSGMRVGEISSIKEGLYFSPIEVQPAFKFNKLREVMVVLDTGY
jgi:rod shape-determining protein MreC